MIVEALLWLVRTIVTAPFDLLPLLGLEDVGVDPATIEGWGADLGEALGPVDVFFPAHEMASFVLIIWTVVVPIELGFALGRFVWRYVPWLGR